MAILALEPKNLSPPLSCPNQWSHTHILRKPSKAKIHRSLSTRNRKEKLQKQVHWDYCCHASGTRASTRNDNLRTIRTWSRRASSQIHLSRSTLELRRRRCIAQAPAWALPEGLGCWTYWTCWCLEIGYFPFKQKSSTLAHSVCILPPDHESPGWNAVQVSTVPAFPNARFSNLCWLSFLTCSQYLKHNPLKIQAAGRTAHMSAAWRCAWCESFQHLCILTSMPLSFV